eukprot:CAMPEP_0185746974 /NCGR_PEP_ID=MMETSP1174-20130828/5643_1 /TAXON_ID=35687 /ORGANISM="Dictyocha speculum, Strain CCMP1381" /LENGTH=55 /DNA_ID=CAMNT_0028421957 /DNA_START=52 /DNA_END=216 /DNA_ORIENTATION=+
MAHVSPDRTATAAHLRSPDKKHNVSVLDLQEAWNSQSRKNRPGRTLAQLRAEVDD